MSCITFKLCKHIHLIGRHLADLQAEWLACEKIRLAQRTRIGCAGFARNASECSRNKVQPVNGYALPNSLRSPFPDRRPARELVPGRVQTGAPSLHASHDFNRLSPHYTECSVFVKTGAFIGFPFIVPQYLSRHRFSFRVHKFPSS